jgi:AcrR family transcriptional regulator
MTGLRDRKKQELRHRMIQAAGRLFADQGLDDTTMEDIAEAADVSVGTVYNYFGSKNVLLLAGVEEDTDEMIARGAAVLATPGPDPVGAVRRLLDVYIEVLGSWDPRLLRQILGIAFQRIGGEELTKELFAMDQRLIEQMMTLLTHFQTKQKLRQDIDIYEATLLLFSTFVTHLFMLVSLEHFTVEDIHNHVGRQIELAFSGLAPQPSKKARKK